LGGGEKALGGGEKALGGGEKALNLYEPRDSFALDFRLFLRSIKPILL
jgi:hypothetical protein